jgi:hypothetical protein
MAKAADEVHHAWFKNPGETDDFAMQKAIDSCVGICTLVLQNVIDLRKVIVAGLAARAAGRWVPWPPCHHIGFWGGLAGCAYRENSACFQLSVRPASVACSASSYDSLACF